MNRKCESHWEHETVFAVPRVFRALNTRGSEHSDTTREPGRNGKLPSAKPRLLTVRAGPSKKAARLGTIPAAKSLLIATAVQVTAVERREVGKSEWLRLANPWLFSADEAWVLSREKRRRMLQPLCDGDVATPSVDLTRWVRELQRDGGGALPERPTRPPLRGTLAFRGLECGVQSEYRVDYIGADQQSVKTILFLPGPGPEAWSI